MTVKELKDKLNSMHEIYDDNIICVKVIRRGSMGGTPTVGVRSISNGFDWDSRRCIIHTDKDIIEIPTNEKRDIIIDDIIE